MRRAAGIIRSSGSGVNYPAEAVRRPEMPDLYGFDACRL
jgi:hypothetical protein